MKEKKTYNGAPADKGDEKDSNKTEMNEKEADASTSAEGEGIEVEDVVPEDGEEDEISRLTAALEEQKAATEKEKKEYLFLMAEFDNFRKRTLKEKSEIIKNAGEQVLKGILPIIDDFERGLEATKDSDNAESVREGMVLIYNKLKKYLEQNGVKEIDPEDREFDTERHEAISVVPVPEEDKKGKILDTIQKGYMINDKVLRHAKVVVGQ